MRITRWQFNNNARTRSVCIASIGWSIIVCNVCELNTIGIHILAQNCCFVTLSRPIEEYNPICVDNIVTRTLLFVQCVGDSHHLQLHRASIRVLFISCIAFAFAHVNIVEWLVAFNATNFFLLICQLIHKMFTLNWPASQKHSFQNVSSPIWIPVVGLLFIGGK